MAKRVWVLSLLVAIAISLGIFTLKGFTGEQAGDENRLKLISEKIDKVLKNQEDIIKRLEDIRQQEDVIRIRASRR